MKLDGTAELKQQQVNSSSRSLFQEKDEKNETKAHLGQILQEDNCQIAKKDTIHQWQNVHMEFHEEKEITINISINT